MMPETELKKRRLGIFETRGLASKHAPRAHKQRDSRAAKDFNAGPGRQLPLSDTYPRACVYLGSDHCSYHGSFDHHWWFPD